MNKCLYCYKELDAAEDYHTHCAKAFFGTATAPILPYQMEDIVELARDSVTRSITLPGVQPKLSLDFIKERLKDPNSGRLTILDALDGHFILKPQNEAYAQMPEIEHLSMRLAELFKIHVVPSSLIRLASGELCYITKRVDRTADGSKRHMIDFLQILELQDKYLGTMEMLGKEIGKLSSNTLLDKLRFFELTLFNYIIGNNDMHLKNYSMILSDDGWVLSPAYDLINLKLILPNDQEDTALMLGGKKQNFSKFYFDRFADNLNLNEKQKNSIYKRLQKWLPTAIDLIKTSFINEDFKSKYIQLIMQRSQLFQ